MGEVVQRVELSLTVTSELVSHSFQSRTSRLRVFNSIQLFLITFNLEETEEEEEEEMEEEEEQDYYDYYYYYYDDDEEENEN